MIFLRPWALILFIFLPFLYRHGWQVCVQWSSLDAFCDSALLEAMGRYQIISQKKSRYVFLLSIIFMIIALAGPSFGRIKIPLHQPSSPLFILLNTDTSMLQSERSINRFDNAMLVIDRLLSNIKQPVAMIAYTSQPFLVSPMTTDVNTLRHILKELSPSMMPIQGSVLSTAIDMARDRLSTFLSQAPRVLIVTDTAPSKTDEIATERLGREGVRIDVLVVGKINESLFQGLTTNGGRVLPATITSLSDLALSQQISTTVLSKQSTQIPRDDGIFCLMFAVFCWFYALVRGEIA